MKRKDADLIRRYIRESIIIENEGGGGDSGGGAYDSSAYMGSYASGGYGAGLGGHVKKALFDPVADIFKVFAGKTKELFAAGAQISRIAFSTALETLTLGLIQADYQKIHNDYKSQVSKIKSEYASTYAKSWDALRNSDFLAIATFMNPGLFLTTKLIGENPELAANVMSVMALDTTPVGGILRNLAGIAPAAGVTTSIAGAAKAGALAAGARKIAKSDFTDGAPDSMFASKGKKESISQISFVLNEEDKQEEDEKNGGLKKKLIKILNSKEFKSSINPDIKQASAGANKVIDQYFMDLKDEIKSLMSAKDLASLGNDQKVDKELSKITDEKERQKAEATLLAATKNAVLTKEIKKLQSERNKVIEDLKKVGVPNDIAMAPGGLPARYNEEIQEIAKLAGVQVSPNDKG
jgi:hypothetical protein